MVDEYLKLPNYSTSTFRMNNTKDYGNCYKKTKATALFTTEDQQIEHQVPFSTQIRNAISANIASRRNKMRLENDDMLARKNKVRVRLQAKLKKKLKNKKSN